MRSSLLPCLALVVCCAAGSHAVAQQQQRLTPQGAMRALVAAIEAGDEAAIAECFHVQGDPDGAVVRSVSRQLLAGREYWRSMCRTFGRRAAIEAYVKRRMILPDGYLDYPNARWSLDGDRATLVRRDEQAPRAPSPIKRVDGQWLIDIAPNSTAAERNRIVAEMDRAARRFSDAAAAIQSGDFETVHDAIEMLYPNRRLKKELIGTRPPLTKEQLDPATISGSVLSLSQAIEREDAESAAHFYAVDAPGGDELVRAHVRRLIAVNRFVSAVADQVEGTDSLASEFTLLDARDDFYGHLTTRWQTDGDRASGRCNTDGNEGPQVLLIRRAGSWRIDLTPAEGDADARSLAARLEHEARAVTEVTRAIADGQIFTVNEVRQALKRAGLTPTVTVAATEASHNE